MLLFLLLLAQNLTRRVPYITIVNIFSQRSESVCWHCNMRKTEANRKGNLPL